MTMFDEDLDIELFEDLLDYDDDFEYDDDDDDYEYELDDDDGDAEYGEYLYALGESGVYDDLGGVTEFDLGEDAELRRGQLRRLRRLQAKAARSRRRVPRARGRRYMPRRRQNLSRYATKSDLASGLAKARKEVLRNAKGIKTLDRRVAGVAAAGRSSRAKLRTDTDVKLKKMQQDMAQKQQLAMLLPLLTSGDAQDYTISNLNQANNTVTLTPTGGGNDSMLPLLLMGGSSGADNSDMLMMLALSGSL